MRFACLAFLLSLYGCDNQASKGSAKEEYWQLVGTGNTYAAATRVVDDGSTLSYAFRYGQGADSDLINTTKFYYNPTHDAGWVNGVRTASNGSTDATPTAISHFTPTASGLKVVCDMKNVQECSATDAFYMNASQAIPLAASKKVRLFFEASDLSVVGPANTTQIFSLDSYDGYRGEDFNSGASTVCGGAKSTDYAPTGPCAPTLVVATNEETGLAQARQFKIGFPKLTSWLWDESPGTFMVITGSDRCAQTNDGLFYAQYESNRWKVIKDDKGCAKPLVPYAHGPIVTHQGGGKYKLYYEDIMSNVSVGTVTKPLRFITADAARTGDPDLVDFEDWDAYTAAQEVTFLWPDGTQLTGDEESGLGDHFIYAPDGVGSQVMYMNLGGFDNRTSPTASTGIGMAVPVEK